MNVCNNLIKKTKNILLLFFWSIPFSSNAQLSSFKADSLLNILVADNVLYDCRNMQHMKKYTAFKKWVELTSTEQKVAFLERNNPLIKAYVFLGLYLVDVKRAMMEKDKMKGKRKKINYRSGCFTFTYKLEVLLNTITQNSEEFNCFTLSDVHG